MNDDLLKIHKRLASVLGHCIALIAAPKTRSRKQTLHAMEAGLLECLKLVSDNIARLDRN